MHGLSHAVMRLSVHLLNQKLVTFKDCHEKALDAARSRQTLLESWFQLNQRDPDAQTLLYSDIPCNYVCDRNNWLVGWLIAVKWRKSQLDHTPPNIWCEGKLC
ncbi:hypothetical protein AVEN_199460-1 [Araneus ventricosus]|uniref:Uncharacterized protein n=1 Tax=Araneus ventricosus TaxID=182803 RepID=A0A4Y2LDP9_ARAVE|nr:hypothetical protein AVEN_199460-1 [Araneus ventricosus]